MVRIMVDDENRKQGNLDPEKREQRDLFPEEHDAEKQGDDHAEFGEGGGQGGTVFRNAFLNGDQPEQKEHPSENCQKHRDPGKGKYRAFVFGGEKGKREAGNIVAQQNSVPVSRFKRRCLEKQGQRTAAENGEYKICHNSIHGSEA